MKVCTAEQMRKIDRTASDLGGIPSIVLMENAAIACVDEIKKLSVRKIGIFCGKGNNGGDGLAIARHLYNKGYEVEVFLLFGSDFSKDALINYDILEKTGAKIIEITDDSPTEYYISAQDLVVDAIFGTGIHGEISGTAFDVIESINIYSKKTLSVDIPSGIDSDNGRVCSVAVKADMTVTFAAYKRGMFLYPGAEYVGEIIFSDISIPDYIIKNCGIDINTADKFLAKKLLPKRADNAHKGDCGKVFVAGGSVGMTGAPALSSLAALKCGAGLVTAGIPASLNQIMEVKLTEAMTLPLPEKDGMLSSEAVNEIKCRAEKSDVLLLGPGLGRSEEVNVLVSEVLKYSRVTTVVDADALYAVSQMPDMLVSCGCSLIFTPHEAEFARLVGKTTEEVSENRLELSKKFAAENGITLILKGHHTIVTSPDGRQYINTSGNSGMATGGSGDVLAGMTAAFAAAGLEETEAAVLAVYIHGLAGDIAAEKLGRLSLTALDICDNICSAISNITGSKY